MGATILVSLVLTLRALTTVTALGQAFSETEGFIARSASGSSTSCELDYGDEGLIMIDYDEGRPLFRDGSQAILSDSPEGDFGSIGLDFPADSLGYGLDLVYTDSENRWILAIYDNNEVGYVTNSSNGPDFVPGQDPNGPKYVTTIWTNDCDDGPKAILPNGQEYSFRHNPETNHITATVEEPQSTKLRPRPRPRPRQDPIISRLLRWATRHKGSTNPPPTQDEQRCPFDAESTVREGAPPNTPNGCGAANGMRIPQFGGVDFTRCCDGHDTCFGDCESRFVDCNAHLRSCQQGRCRGLPQGTKGERDRVTFCLWVVDAYYGAVSGDRGRDAFRAATDERCKCKCAEWDDFCKCMEGDMEYCPHKR